MFARFPWRRLSPVLALLLGWAGLPLRAEDKVEASWEMAKFRQTIYQVYRVEAKKEVIHLYWKDGAGKSYRTFSAVEQAVSDGKHTLEFATNAGMFHEDRQPVGLLVQKGVESSPLNLEEGPGNFFLKPNGVFLLTESGKAKVMESGAYQTFAPKVMWATQSGPLLVHQGDIHPDFIADSKNVNIRSGVGVTREGQVIFAISTTPVNFYDFALFFRQILSCPNALYLDGSISAFYRPGMKEKAGDHNFGPIFAIES